MNNLNWENLRSTGKNISEKGVYIVIMGMVLAVLPLLSVCPYSRRFGLA